MTQLLIRDGGLYCPVCDLPLIKIEHKYQVAVESIHPPDDGKLYCAFNGQRFRVHPVTGYAERLEKVAHP